MKIPQGRKTESVMTYIMRFTTGTIFICIFLILIHPAYPAVSPETDRFKVLPWEVGQYATYQVVSIENESIDNRYKFSLVGKEKINNMVYFWMEIEISEGPHKKANCVIRALVPPLTSE